MKTTLFLLLTLFLSTFVYGQYSRSFLTDELETRRLSNVTEVNGQMHFFTIRYSTLNDLVVYHGSLSNSGETSNYMIAQLAANLGDNFVLSGIAVQGSIVTLAIQGESGTNAKLSYAQLDLSSNSILNFNSLPGTYRKGFSRSRQVNNQLITYLVKETGGLERVSTSLTNTSSSTFELVDATESSAYAFTTNFKVIELQIENGNECAMVRNRLIKRVSAGNYLETTVSNFSPVGSTALVLTSSNQIVAFQGNKYASYDQSLNVNTSGNLSGTTPIGSSQRYYEAYEVNNGFRIYHESIGAHLSEVNSTFTVQNTEEFIDFFPFGVNRIGPALYLYGQRTNQPISINASGTILTNPNSSMAVIQDYMNATPSPFIEFAQAFTAGNFKGLIGLLGNGFSISQLSSSSLRFNMNGIDRTVLYSSADYFVGYDANNSLVGFHDNFSGVGYILPGPFTNGVDYDYEMMDQYNRGYYVSQQMITDHAANISSGNPNYEIPFGIKFWPAHGDVTKGQASNLASYVDVNTNGTYDPENGDYPQIYGSQCILNIYHQPEFSTESAEIETHYYTFSFDCDTSETLKNTLFTRNHTFARGQDLYDVIAGKYLDIDVGTSSDDYSGTHVEFGMVYGYNGDNYDEQNGPDTGFNDTIPAFGVMTLKGSKRGNDGQDNGYGINLGQSVNGLGFGDGTIDNEFNTLEASYTTVAGNPFPNGLQSMYNVANGLNPDGSPNLAIGTVATRYSYFGDSDPLYYATGGINPASTYTENALGNVPGDRYMFSSAGESDLLMGDTLVQVDAYLVAVDSVNIGNTALYSVNKLFERAQQVKNFFEAANIGCGYNFNPTSLEIEEENLPNIQIYPNPTNSTLTLNLINGTEMTLEVRDINGRMVIPKTKANTTTTLDFSALENATYLVVISTDLGTTVSRVVKY